VLVHVEKAPFTADRTGSPDDGEQFRRLHSRAAQEMMIEFRPRRGSKEQKVIKQLPLKRNANFTVSAPFSRLPPRRFFMDDVLML
jgi:hypothetical protein